MAFEYQLAISIMEDRRVTLVIIPDRRFTTEAKAPPFRVDLVCIDAYCLGGFDGERWKGESRAFMISVGQHPSRHVDWIRMPVLDFDVFIGLVK